MCGKVVDEVLVDWMGRVHAHYIGPLPKKRGMQRHMDYCGPVHMVKKPKGDTDTHLNAAAPDMLQCLRQFVTVFDTIANVDGFCEVDWEDLDALRSERDRAAEIIKQAERVE